MGTPKVKINDRVKRTQTGGCLGTVKDVRTEVTASSQEAKDKGLMISVRWDNGTTSYLSPEGLEVVND